MTSLSIYLLKICIYSISGQLRLGHQFIVVSFMYQDEHPKINTPLYVNHYRNGSDTHVCKMKRPQRINVVDKPSRQLRCVCLKARLLLGGLKNPATCTTHLLNYCPRAFSCNAWNLRFSRSRLRSVTQSTGGCEEKRIIVSICRPRRPNRVGSSRAKETTAT